MNKNHEERLLKLVHKTLSSLSFVAPEDVDMQKTKIFYALAEASQPLYAIYEVLNGKEWSPDDLDEIARILEDAGFHIEEP